MEEKHSGCNRGPGTEHVDRTEERGQAQRLDMKENVVASGRGEGELGHGATRGLERGHGRRDLGKGKAIGPHAQAGGVVAPDPSVGKNGGQDRPQAGAKRGEGQQEEARPQATLVLTSWQCFFR